MTTTSSARAAVVPSPISLAPEPSDSAPATDAPEPILASPGRITITARADGVSAPIVLAPGRALSLIGQEGTDTHVGCADEGTTHPDGRGSLDARSTSAVGSLAEVAP